VSRLRADRQQRRDDHGADAGRGAEPPVADVADVEPVVRDGGQQGDGAAEQDREEIERDRAEQHRPAAHEPQPLHRVVPGRALIGWRPLLDAAHLQRGDRDPGDDEAGGRDGVRHRWVDVIEQSAARRSNDQSHLPRRRVDRHHAGQRAVGCHQWRDRADRGRHERSGGPEQRRDHEDRQRARGVRRGVPAEHHGREDLGAEADGADPPPVETIGRRPGERQEQERRKELDEAEHAEGELAVGDVVHLLAQRCGLEEHADRRQRGGHEVHRDRAVPDHLPRRRAAVGRWRVHRHDP
jgi:hypothetical protein